ncbi:MAG: hypothetical protein K0R54_1821 [Clostridiaceae bacterium]|jgi:hypothetical protein|nr:hypothetical protein [Clostridiaceae bacterium]
MEKTLYLKYHEEYENDYEFSLEPLELDEDDEEGYKILTAKIELTDNKKVFVIQDNDSDRYIYGIYTLNTTQSSLLEIIQLVHKADYRDEVLYKTLEIVFGKDINKNNDYNIVKF